LRHRRRNRDEDGRVDAQLPGCPCDCLPVVACARRDNTGSTFFRRQGRELVHSAADLECAGPLEVLRLESHLAAHAARERLREIDRSLFRDSPKTLARLPDVSESRWTPLYRPT